MPWHFWNRFPGSLSRHPMTRRDGSSDPVQPLGSKTQADSNVRFLHNLSDIITIVYKLSCSWKMCAIAYIWYICVLCTYDYVWYVCMAQIIRSNVSFSTVAIAPKSRGSIPRQKHVSLFKAKCESIIRYTLYTLVNRLIMHVVQCGCQTVPKSNNICRFHAKVRSLTWWSVTQVWDMIFCCTSLIHTDLSLILLCWGHFTPFPVQKCFKFKF